MHAATQPTPTPTTTTEYFVGILMLGVRHYFPVGSRTAATALAKTAAWVHNRRASAEDGSQVHLGCVWVELADLDRPRVVPLNLAQLMALARTKADEWQALLRKHAPIARQMVRKLVEGRILFTPDLERRRYTFRMTGTLANLFSGIVCPQAVASPTGFEPVFWP